MAGWKTKNYSKPLLIGLVPRMLRIFDHYIENTGQVGNIKLLDRSSYHVVKDNTLPTQHALDTALLQWISEHAVRAYTTADSAVLYLNHARIALTTPSFAL